MTSEMSPIGERTEPPRVVLAGVSVAQLRSDGLALWDGGKGVLLRTDPLQSTVALTPHAGEVFTFSRPAASGTICRHSAQAAGTPVCARVGNDSGARELSLLIAGPDGHLWLEKETELLELVLEGSALEERGKVRRRQSAQVLPDGTIVESGAGLIEWTPLRGGTQRTKVDCDARVIAGQDSLLVLTGQGRPPGEEGLERWQAVRVAPAGSVTILGELLGHPYDAVPWRGGVAVLRGNRSKYSEPVRWDLVLIDPGSPTREESLPIQPGYVRIWDSGWSIAAAGDLVAVGNRDRLAVFDLAQSKWTITDGPTD